MKNGSPVLERGAYKLLMNRPNAAEEVRAILEKRKAERPKKSERGDLSKPWLSPYYDPDPKKAISPARPDQAARLARAGLLARFYSRSAYVWHPKISGEMGFTLDFGGSDPTQSCGLVVCELIDAETHAVRYQARRTCVASALEAAIDELIRDTPTPTDATLATVQPSTSQETPCH